MTTPKWTQAQTIYESNGIVTKYDGMFHEGFVTTYYGYVNVWSRAFAHESWTRLEFIHDGLLWARVYDGIYQPRYLVTLAKRFAAEIAAPRDGA